MNEKQSEPHLAEAVVDFQEDKLVGQLTIKAPNARVLKVDENSSLGIESITSCTTKLTRPRGPRGYGVLVEIVDGEAVLQFGGGCQGCAAVDMTPSKGWRRRFFSVARVERRARLHGPLGKRKRILLSLRVRRSPGRVSF